MNGNTPGLWAVSCPKSIQYDIAVCGDIFEKENDALASIGAGYGSRRFIVLDSKLESWESKIKSYFDSLGIVTKIVLFQAGEENKTIAEAMRLIDVLDIFPINRRSEPIIAIGGGVLTDLVAFVASIYRRGVPHVKVPTTLMGYIDAAVGIKCGVNSKKGKNRIGAFEPPLKVLLDKTFLWTLPDRHILNGLGEIIKLAVILDAKLFEELESVGPECVARKFQSSSDEKILKRSVDIMVQELASNPYEENLCRAVDFGHTFSPAYEMESRHKILHGEAVLIDIILSVFLANIKGILSAEQMLRILNLTQLFPWQFPGILIESASLWDSLNERTCHRDGKQRVPLPRVIGEGIFVNDITFAELDAANSRLKKWIGDDGTICERRCG